MGTQAVRPLTGRVAVVTGGTSGIGLEIARGLARLGATTVIVGRGTERTQRIATQLATDTGNPSVAAMGVTDLALLSDTRRAADLLRNAYPKIHILVNNAGAFFRRREVTAEGHERTFALNVLSPFLLSSLLVTCLADSVPARIVNVSSAAHEGREIDFGALESPGRYGSGFGAYGVSKLELLLLTREFARRLVHLGVTVNAVHPGFVRSGFAKNNGGGTAAMVGFFALLFGRSAKRGADTPIFVASDPSFASITGEYVSDRKILPGSAQSQDLETARRLFETCRDITGAPEIPPTPVVVPAGST